MSALEVTRQRKSEIDATLAKIKTDRTALLDAAVAEKRALTEDEQARFDALTGERETALAELAPVTERIAELEDDERRTKAEADNRVKLGLDATRNAGGAQVTDPPVYARDRYDTSYFRDLYNATRRGDTEAAQRLRRSHAMEAEKRALGNTGAVGGSGGEFAPPEWLVSEFVALARPGRVGVDLFDGMPLPPGISTINVPKVATGTAVAVQTTQNTALQQTDLTTTSLSSGIATIGGKQVVSLQLLEQSAIPFDRVVLEDLSLAYAGQVDTQALTGAGTGGTLRGLGSAAGLTVQTYTQTTPAVAGAGGFYSNVAKAIASVYGTRFLPPDTILMHPRRWAWILSAFDSQNRPLVVPGAVAFNPVTTQEAGVAQGLAGQLQGLAVYTDPNIPINLGAGTNQDVVYVFRRGDIKFWESTPRAEAFDATYADSAGVLFRLL